MAGLGGTNLKKRVPERETPEQSVNKFLTSSSVKETGKESVKGKQKFTVQVGVKLSKEQSDQLELVKRAIGTNQDTTALRYCFDEFWKIHGEKITKKAEKIKEITSA